MAKQSELERSAALTCTLINSKSPHRSELSAFSAKDFTKKLAVNLGPEVAKREVSLALNDLNFNENESRPYALRRLREQVESNLSGLLGTSTAQGIIEHCLAYKPHLNLVPDDDIYCIENRVESYKNRLTGLAKELDNLRRFHRQVINDLPIGVCSLANFNEIVNWNRALEKITHISSKTAIGSCTWHLPKPWGEFIAELVRLPNSLLSAQRELKFSNHSRHFKIHKAFINTKSKANKEGNLVLVIEDITDLQILENKMAHNQRLASIGMLAAGVAHEIGNPITAIACLAQDICSELLDATETPDQQSGLTPYKSIHRLNRNIEIEKNSNKRDTLILEMAEQIQNQTKRVSQIVQSLINFSHSGQSAQPSLIKLNIHAIIKESIDLIQLAPSNNHVHYINQCDKGLHIYGDHQLMIQVFINLLSNASDASQPEGHIIVNTTANDDDISITVSDNGSGISNEIMPTVFDPFVTTKSPGSGTGLGLALVYRFITDQGGSVEIQSPSLINNNTINTNTQKGADVSIIMPTKIR